MHKFLFMVIARDTFLDLYSIIMVRCSHLRRSFFTFLGFLMGCILIEMFKLSHQMYEIPSSDVSDNIWGPNEQTSKPVNSHQQDEPRPFPGKLFHFEKPWGDETYTISDKEGPGINLASPEKHLIGQSQDDQEFLAWMQNQDRRRQRIKKYCESHPELPKTMQSQDSRVVTRFLKTVIVDEKYKVLYCPVGKVACTSWKTAMAIMQGHYDGLKPGEHIHDTKVLLRNDLKLLNMFSAHTVQNRLKTYPSFLFARHPFERLLSAYRNKFLTENRDDYQKRYGVKIIKEYRANATEEEIKNGWGVRFSEFVKWILGHNVHDIHWDFFNSICHLCSVNYEYIGLMDTFEADTKFMLKALYNTTDTGFFPHSNPSKENSRDVMLKYFKDVTEEDILRLKQKYEIDFEMFGFKWPL